MVAFGPAFQHREFERKRMIAQRVTSHSLTIGVASGEASGAQTNFAPPGDNIAPPPGRNSANFAPLPHTNCQPANNLRGRGGANWPHFAPPEKRKNSLLQKSGA
jgi:hypothetical protein